MKKYIILAVLIVMFGWAVYDFVQSNETNQEQDDSGFMISSEPNAENTEESKVGLDIGSKAPDFELENLQGETVKLSDYRGQKVMINFWATWCPPCRAEMPDMQKFYEEKEVVILAVDMFETEQNLDNVKNFKNDFNLTFPILIDEGDVSTEYQILPIPTSYFVDSKGIIRHKSMGAMNYEQMIQAYEKMD
ncbi:TlpA family protein disulfide reductase [Piscibacillus salipiscarius]|uniref:TlpA family protein disulfide reductase n=1 Tax=Piscibacillus salipiscarius TaxID=299480 RepID=A0ABW5Q9J6_9BACI|nr:TlpA disulfide reductase family protein [Piscibacillus salipiscarius]